ncbi:MAG: hypothetical protein FWD75_00600 [Propionibacteriaceae bacterium]|nr:hypothetical protein [Propionibacteriaceae bacterium]
MSDIDPQSQQSVMAAPLPTPATLKHRKNLFYQLLRFAAINVKMIRVIGSSHH